MNTNQRLHQLEQKTLPKPDTREPLLVEFLGVTDEPKELAGILYIYGGDGTTEHRLNSQQLADYKAGHSDLDIERIINLVPRPSEATQ